MIHKPNNQSEVIKQMPVDDPIVFAVRGQFYYKNTKIENLTREQLLEVLRKILKKEVFK
jgi:hypothetical protein